MKGRIILLNGTFDDTEEGDNVVIPNGVRTISISHEAVKSGSSATLTLAVQYSFDGNLWKQLQELVSATSVDSSGIVHITDMVANAPAFLKAIATFSAPSANWDIAIRAYLG